jgi:hypothetical protein
MQEELVQAMRRQVLLTAAQEEQDWEGTTLYRPEVAAWFRRQADELE